jgi:hypothetical protein
MELLKGRVAEGRLGGMMRTYHVLALTGFVITLTSFCVISSPMRRDRPKAEISPRGWDSLMDAPPALAV